MPIKFKIYDYYNNGLHKPYFLKIEEPGIYYIVGPNGSGKTSLLYQLKDYAEKNKYKVLSYSDIADGRSNGVDRAAYRGNYNDIATLMTSSEGESIYYNFGLFISSVGKAIRENNKLFILIDGIDSGMSIDKLREIREFFDDVLNKDIYENCKLFYDTKESKQIYVFVTANNFELVRGDVYRINPYNGKRINFKTYNVFEKYIINYRNRFPLIEKGDGK